MRTKVSTSNRIYSQEIAEEIGLFEKEAEELSDWQMQALTIITALEEWLDDMNEREYEFVTSMSKKFATYGAKSYISKDQMDWLQKLSQRFLN